MGQSSTAKERGSRDAASKVAQQRLSVLELARELGSVGEACRQCGMDRSSFYEWPGSFLPTTLGETYATADIIAYDGKARVKTGREFLLD